VVVWEFHVKAGHEAAFRDAYDEQGLWAQFFRRSEGYIGTELLEDEVNNLRFLTIDRWASEASYLAFHCSHETEYQDIDRQCLNLTSFDAKTGAFLSSAS
jgi:heme-degrading monooxygenase HmoA